MRKKTNTGGVIIVGNYMPSNHEASRIIDPKGIAPTIKENHGTVNAVVVRGGVSHYQKCN